MQQDESIDGETARAVADWLRVIGNPQRIRVLARLRVGAAAVSEIRQDLDASHHNIVNHLGILQRAGLVRCAGVGPLARYRLCDESPCEIYDLIIAGLADQSRVAA